MGQQKRNFDVSDYLEENRELALRVMNKRLDNHHRVERLEQQGTQLDVTLARLEFMLRQFVELGLLSQETMLQMQMQWEENMASQLAMIEDNTAMRIEKAKKERDRMVREAAAQQIATPQTGLLLPNGRVHLPQPEEKSDE